MYVQSFKLWIVNFVWKLFSNIYIAHIGKENPNMYIQHEI